VSLNPGHGIERGDGALIDEARVRVARRDLGDAHVAKAGAGQRRLVTLFIFGALQVGYSLALFQLSTLISVFLGYRFFAERNIRRRLIGSVVMVIGAALIVSLGRPT